MKQRIILFVLCAIFAYGCASTGQQAGPETTPAVAKVETGVASWYGQEFAGRTTANGEIFDPMLMTAAHRTLPFGTIVDVKNPKTGQTVRVRINDRGPFVGNRLIDLSYAAAQQISLIEAGSGDIEMSVVKLGSLDREPPAPYTVTISDSKPKGTGASEPPPVEFPLPSTATPKSTPAPAVASKPAPEPVPPAPTPSKPAAAETAPAPVTAAPAPAVENDFRVEVIEQPKGSSTDQRKQVASSGQSIERAPAPKKAATTPAPAPKNVASAPVPEAAPAPAEHARTGRFVVQVGAFAQEANAKALQDKLSKMGVESFIDHTKLYHVRIGPFQTKEQAIKSRENLETAGISAIIVVP
ncbi:MAG TPA: septal ring lytic transglycosylase RlpA family protein [Thermoanaerobaculia bacterium]|nr:septal ring lytic transglycosylase RlpA family protein [Thermoanaerobaculia bacterium]